MQKIVEMIKKLFGKSSKPTDSSSSGFTLIELLIVIAVIGVLAAATLIAIDPVDRINSANDSRVQRDIAGIASAAEAYAASNNGFFAANTADLVTAGELRSAPTAPGGYTAYSYVTTPATCTSGTTCTAVVITGTVKSKKYTNSTTNTPIFRYESSTGKKCFRANATTACP